MSGRIDDGFDLPRYATRDDPSMHSGTHYLYSSAASSPQTATHDHNAFVSNPPTNPILGQPRQGSRYSQVQDGEHSGTNLARSASLNNASRNRPPHQVAMADDRDRVYSTEGHSSGNSQRHLANSFYPAALGFGGVEPPAAPSQQQQDYLSFAPENPVRRSNTHTDSSRKNVSASSAAGPGVNPTLIPAINEQAYPSTSMSSTYNDPYAGGYSGNNEASLGAAPGSVHHSKGPPSPLSINNYNPQTAAQIPQSQRSPHAETQLFHAASSFSTLTSGTPISLDPSQTSSRQYYPTPSQIAVSNPGTPISQGSSRQASHLQQQQYQIQDYNQQMQPIKTEPSPQQRRVGFKRVRDARDLRPMTNSQPSGRRVDASGVFVSVSYLRILSIMVR